MEHTGTSATLTSAEASSAGVTPARSRRPGLELEVVAQIGDDRQAGQQRFRHAREHVVGDEEGSRGGQHDRKLGAGDRTDRKRVRERQHAGGGGDREQVLRRVEQDLERGHTCTASATTESRRRSEPPDLGSKTTEPSRQVRKVTEIWLKYEVDPTHLGANRVFLTFDISRDGHPSNIHLEQSSGVPSLDLSA